ncbi:MAG: Hsp70 family protein [Planctomycetaceae bacterium]
MSDKYHMVIGIDLGTTYSAVAVYNRFDEQTEIIPNPESRDHQGRLKPETTPSVISRDRHTGKAIVGWPAKRNVGDAQNTVIEIKREMGEVFSEMTLDKFHARGTFRAKQDGAGGFEGDPVKVRYMEEWYFPQEISAFTLIKMKEVAEAHIGAPIRDAVITVPAYFTEKQKKATEEAALLAGLYPRQLIPEPTAAAICYGVDRMESKRKVYLVYDLGGGTFDVSIISVEGQVIGALATSGDPRLGGGDFDDEIVKWVIQELRDKHQLDPGNDREKLARIKAHAEQAKKELSALNSVMMTFIDVWPQQSPSVELTREKFESLIEPLLNKSLTFVDAALNQAEKTRGLRRSDLDAILLVGGSTKIPRVKSLLLEHFQQEESFVSKGMNPDEVVARGAATVAVKFAPSTGEFDITKRPDQTLVNPDLEDDVKIDLITEHSLGVGVQNNEMSRVIEVGTSIPVKQKKGGFTNGGPTTHLDVPVYQGEGQFTYQNTLIGKLNIGPMEPRPADSHQFEVTFSLDDNGLLSLTVHHINENKTYQGQFDQKTGVGGKDALMARRTKLLSLYGGPITGPGTVMPPMEPVRPNASAKAPVGAAPTSAVAPTPPGQPTTGWAPAAAPVSPGGPGQPVASPVVIPPAAAQPAAAPASAAVGGVPHALASVATPPTSPAAPGVPMPSVPVATVPVATPPAPVAAANAILEPKVDVPAEFKSIVRRASKMLLDGGPEKLREAFNRFVTLLNQGAAADSDQLTEAGDELADVYQDCR